MVINPSSSGEPDIIHITRTKNKSLIFTLLRWKSRSLDQSSAFLTHKHHRARTHLYCECQQCHSDQNIPFARWWRSRCTEQLAFLQAHVGLSIVLNQHPMPTSFLCFRHWVAVLGNAAAGTLSTRVESSVQTSHLISGRQPADSASPLWTTAGLRPLNRYRANAAQPRPRKTHAVWCAYTHANSSFSHLCSLCATWEETYCAAFFKFVWRCKK